MIKDYEFSPPCTLSKRKGKFYVCVTVPLELRPFYSEKQIRRSTGTIDKAVANERAALRYAELLADLKDKASRLDPFIEGIRKNLSRHAIDVGEWYRSGTLSTVLVGEETTIFKMGGPSTVVRMGDGTERLYKLREKVLCKDYADVASLITTLGCAVPSHLLDILPESQKAKIADLARPRSIPASAIFKHPEMLSSDIARELIEHSEANPITPIVVSLEEDLILCFSDVVEDYLASKNAEAKKEQSQRRLACERVIKYCGDLPLAEYTPLHAYDLAKAMDEANFSHAMIKKMVSYGTGLFKYAVKNRDGQGRQLLQVQPWVDIGLRGYGIAKRKYVPFLDDELHALFAQDIPHQERLLLSILVTTGMRLDEAALMTWERLAVYDGVWCFSLANDVEDVKVKNHGSMRYIPVPEALKPILGNGGKGRLFNYRIDQDGKAQAKASDSVMPYIRNVTKNDRKVAHSIRGNFKDFIRDLGVSKEINDFITGHAQGDVAGRYGKGPSMDKRLEVINQIEHPWLK